MHLQIMEVASRHRSKIKEAACATHQSSHFRDKCKMFILSISKLILLIAFNYIGFVYSKHSDVSRTIKYILKC